MIYSWSTFSEKIEFSNFCVQVCCKVSRFVENWQVLKWRDAEVTTNHEGEAESEQWYPALEVRIPPSTRGQRVIAKSGKQPRVIASILALVCFFVWYTNVIQTECTSFRIPVIRSKKRMGFSSYYTSKYKNDIHILWVIAWYTKRRTILGPQILGELWNCLLYTSDAADK